MHNTRPASLFALLLLSRTALCAEPVPEPAPAPATAPAAAPASDSGKTPDQDGKPAKGKPGAPLKAGEVRGKPGNAAQPGDKEQTVTITGSRQSDTEQRRQSSAGKLVYGREELDRNGDTTLGEVLKRLPGVTLGGPAGRGSGIRFRGLGNGYTQILLNGERAPRGFSIEQLSPDQVEKVEIIRGPVAEYSTQAIAGTINIVLREGYQQKETQIRLSDGFEHGRNTPNIAVTYPGKHGNLTYTLTASIFETHTADHNMVENREFNPLPSLIQQVETNSNNHSRGIHLTPRFSYRRDNGDTLVLQPLIVSNRTDSNGQVDIHETLSLPPIPNDPSPPYAHATYNNHNSTELIRTFGNWQQRFADSARLNVKFGFGHIQTEGGGLRLQYGSSGQLQNTIADTNQSKDNTANIGGKYTAPLEKWLGKGHLLAIGWDMELGHREQTKSSINNGAKEFAESGDNVSAKTRTLSTFVQDEWDITEKWSTNLGLRWEGIKTSSDTTIGTITNTSSVWSPVLHNVWRLPGETKDQVRLGLTRSYRAPTLNDLIALPSLSRLNSATRPDAVGNPNLKPELATGVDLAFEHYLSRSGILAINVFRRNITDLIRRTTTLQNGRFVSSPTNFGKANTSGVELEAKFQLAELMDNAPQIDFRSNFSRLWSRVLAVPGPDNRLDSQPKYTGNLGLDYRPAQTRFTIGGSYNWTPAYSLQTSLTEHSEASNKRQLDFYTLYKFDANNQLRIYANNVLHRDYGSASEIQTLNGAQTSQTSGRTYATIGVRWELKI